MGGLVSWFTKYIEQREARLRLMKQVTIFAGVCTAIQLTLSLLYLLTR